MRMSHHAQSIKFQEVNRSFGRKLVVPQEDHSTMALPFFRGKPFAFICLVLLLFAGLAACSADGAQGASQRPTKPSPNGATATAAVEALMKEMTLVGSPTAKIDVGTTF